MHVPGAELQFGTALIGALTGIAYGLLGIGLVLVYRSSRVVNFAHGEIGAFCAAVFAKLVLDGHWNFLTALLTVAALGAVVGAAWELLVVRRLRQASRLILLAATIGISQVMLAAQLMLPELRHPGRFPSAFNWHGLLLGAVLGGGHVAIVIIAPLIVGALAWFLTKTTFGIAIRAAADNTDAARLAGINVRRTSTVVWALAGLLAAVTFVLVNPVRGVLAGSTLSVALGPGLLMRALAAGLIGGFTSLPLTILGGVGIGVVEGLLALNVGNPGLIDACLFVAVLVALFLRSRALAGDRAASWSLGSRLRPVAAHLREITWVRRLPAVTGLGALAVGVLAPIVLRRPSQQFTLSRTLIYALAGLSVVVVTGWAGQLSLSQFAIVGVGAVVTAGLVARGVPFPFAVLYATLAGTITALCIGLPALRIPGLFLTVTTLGFAVAASGWLLPHRLFFGQLTTAFVPRWRWWFLHLDAQRTYYYICLIVLSATGAALVGLRGTGIGRRILAVRENEVAAQAVTIDSTHVKLSAFALSGSIAALSGALLAGLYVQFSAPMFDPAASLSLLSMVIVGGIGSVAGAVLGAIYLIGVPAFTGHWMRHLLGNSDAFVLLLGGVGLIFVLVQNPGGMVEGLYKLRDRLLRRAAQRQTAAAATALRPAMASIVSQLLPAMQRPESGTGDVLVAEDVTVAFGGLVANDHVGVRVAGGEIVGLIGTNGSGKSTLMNAISGYVPAADGRIEIFGSDVTHWPAHERAALGVGRVFQDAGLYPELTVWETVAVALEARRRSEFVPSLLALPPARRAEQATTREAGELVGAFGLSAWADTPIGELSTGTRRFVELAGLCAVGARLILLDEPTAGVAQRETEAFAPLIRDVQEALGATIVIIEHDMPLVMSLSDRIYCLSAGKVIAEGPPERIRRDPQVVAAYLGTDERALRRSDVKGSTKRRSTKSRVPVAAG